MYTFSFYVWKTVYDNKHCEHVLLYYHHTANQRTVYLFFRSMHYVVSTSTRIPVSVLSALPP